MTNEQRAMVKELLSAYSHVDFNQGRYMERTTAAEVLVRCAAKAVAYARSNYPDTKEWANALPLEHSTTVGAYIKALRTGTETAFEQQLDSITDPEIRKIHGLCMNARNVFIDEEDAAKMRNPDEVLHRINLAMSYD